METHSVSVTRKWKLELGCPIPGTGQAVLCTQEKKGWNPSMTAGREGHIVKIQTFPWAWRMYIFGGRQWSFPFILPMGRNSLYFTFLWWFMAIPGKIISIVSETCCFLVPSVCGGRVGCTCPALRPESLTSQLLPTGSWNRVEEGNTSPGVRKGA